MDKKPEPCPRGVDKPEESCTNRHQCWEPCGELGQSEEHAYARGRKIEEQSRVTRWFPGRRVDYCTGHDEARWDSGFVHWLESGGVRGETASYVHPCRLNCGGELYMGFSEYWRGEAYVGEPVQLRAGEVR